MTKNKVKSNVAFILENYPKARNCDKYLTLKYWEIFDKLPLNDTSLVKDFKFAFVNNSTSTESIRRSRQLLQQEGLYPPTDTSVIESRKKRQALFKDSIIKERQVI